MCYSEPQKSKKMEHFQSGKLQYGYSYNCITETEREDLKNTSLCEICHKHTAAAAYHSSVWSSPAPLKGSIISHRASLSQPHKED